MRYSWLRLPCLLVASCASAIDSNSNQQSDIWEMVHGAQGLSATGDPDGDGFSNATESIAGTNPQSAFEFPALRLELSSGVPMLRWFGLAGKHYLIETRTDLSGGGWTPM